MAHLSKLPTYFVKGDQRRAAYYTVTARELLEDGYVEELEDAGDAQPKAPGKLPEKPVVAGGDGFEDLQATAEYEEEVELEYFTKAELVEYATSIGLEFKSNISKADLLALCQEN